ncbi:hydroxyethylthiazole kinase [Breoghania corrubedonensis]|uniref:hydroxyethylthiazole kinase n=1 Tax=Breoghania corrubedonensis TaxID=665038 RepID=A0A2T5V4Q1_9HYPH|nr:hydroxyethylthiazole kinase [Breoghania corrubedonensis]PTW58724.1 hydroxyethylthiazole kinase [Breoghania corrubedonensis]
MSSSDCLPSDHLPLSARISSVLKRLRLAGPRIHCLTGALAQERTADLLMAIGAVPTMGGAPEEVRDFAASADALLIDLGAMEAMTAKTVGRAIDGADVADIPWVLAPVAIDRASARRELAARLLKRRPRILRTNVPELLTLVPPSDSIAGFAKARHTTVILSGVIDTVSDGARQYALSNGHEMMGRTPAMGRAVTAIVTAALAVEPNALVAAAAGVSIVNVAGEIAAERASGLGSFVSTLIDVLHDLDVDDLRQRLDITREDIDAAELIAEDVK